MKKIVITGGTHSGKTSIINELSARGYLTLSEVSMQVVKESIEKIGIERHKKRMFEDINWFALEVAKRQIKAELEVDKTEPLIFCDRGLHDCISFCGLMDSEPSKELLDLVKNHTPYDFVFYCESLPDFNPRPETGRITTKEMSLKMGKLIKKVYLDHTYQLIPIKRDSAKKRVDFILSSLKNIPKPLF